MKVNKLSTKVCSKDGLEQPFIKIETRKVAGVKEFRCLGTKTTKDGRI